MFLGKNYKTITDSYFQGTALKNTDSQKVLLFYFVNGINSMQG